MRFANWTFVLTLLLPVTAHADFLHTFAMINGQRQFWQDGHVVQQSGLQHDSGYEVAALSGYFASTDPLDRVEAFSADSVRSLNNASSMLRVTTESFNCWSAASVGFTDLVTISGANPAPGQLRLWFQMDGEMWASRQDNNSFSWSDARINFGLSGHQSYGLRDYNIYQPYDNWGIIDYTADLNGKSVSVNLGPGNYTPWETLLLGGTDSLIFSGTQSVVSDFDPTLGGYAFSFSAEAGTRTESNSAAKINFGNTGKLIAITLADGSPLNGYDISFASGMTLSAVPEPSSVLFSIIAILGLGTKLTSRRWDVSRSANRDSTGGRSSAKVMG